MLAQAGIKLILPFSALHIDSRRRLTLSQVTCDYTRKNMSFQVRRESVPELWFFYQFHVEMLLGDLSTPHRLPRDSNSHDGVWFQAAEVAFGHCIPQNCMELCHVTVNY